jgi:hypothetical protein
MKKYVINQICFFPPNFSMFDAGEIVKVAECDDLNMANIVVESLMTCIINGLIDEPIKNIVDLNDDMIYVEVVDDQYRIGYGDVTAAIFVIKEICPNCGCNPEDEPYCMKPTHCPQCGHIFED